MHRYQINCVGKYPAVRKEIYVENQIFQAKADSSIFCTIKQNPVVWMSEPHSKH